MSALSNPVRDQDTSARENRLPRETVTRGRQVHNWANTISGENLNSGSREKYADTG